MHCRVVGVGDSGLHVELSPGCVAAFLPKLHLSDHRAMCNALMTTYQVDDVIDRVMYIGKSGGVVSSNSTVFFFKFASVLLLQSIYIPLSMLYICFSVLHAV